MTASLLRSLGNLADRNRAVDWVVSILLIKFKIFKPVLPISDLLMSEWQQVSTGLQNSYKNSN